MFFLKYVFKLKCVNIVGCDWPVSAVLEHTRNTLLCTPQMAGTQRELVKRQTGLVKTLWIFWWCTGPLKWQPTGICPSLPNGQSDSGWEQKRLFVVCGGRAAGWRYLLICWVSWWHQLKCCQAAPHEEWTCLTLLWMKQPIRFIYLWINSHFKAWVAVCIISMCWCNVYVHQTSKFGRLAYLVWASDKHQKWHKHRTISQS